MGVRIVSKGNFNNAFRFLHHVRGGKFYKNLDKYAIEGVEALKNYTPVDSGKTRDSWDYIITEKDDVVDIVWTNSNINQGVKIAVIIQFGHATPEGHYVEGVDYINPALQPIFEDIAERAWKDVTSA